MAANENFGHWFDCHKNKTKKWKNIGNHLLILLIPWIPKLGKTWWSYEIFCIFKYIFKFLSLSQHSTFWHLKTNTIDNPEMIRALLRPQIAIWQHAIYSWFRPLKIKVSRKSYTVITLWGCFTILAFKVSKKLNCSLKIRHFKNVV